MDGGHGPTPFSWIAVKCRSKCDSLQGGQGAHAETDGLRPRTLFHSAPMRRAVGLIVLLSLLTVKGQPLK